MKIFMSVSLILVCLFLINSTLIADSGKFSGYVFGDYYYVLGSHNEFFSEQNGFWLRRIYLTYDKKLSDKFSTRLRFEGATPDGLGSAAGKAEPFIKDAYLKYKTGNHEIVLGISGTPTWGVVEKTWGYRPVEKTPLDLQKIGSSRDFGVAFKGKLGGKFRYHLMLGNGNSNKSENSPGKKIMLSLGYYPTKSLIFEVYGDWADNPEDTDWTTLQAFAAYKSKKARIGLQYAHQTRQGESDLKLRVFSIFGVFNISAKTSLFARVDKMLDANPSGEKIAYIPFSADAKSTFVVAGLDWKVLKGISFMPNIELILYDDPAEGDKPDSDTIFRVTFYYKF